MMTGLVPSWCMHQVERLWSMLWWRMNWNLLRVKMDLLGADIDLNKAFLDLGWASGICNRHNTWRTMI